MSEVPLGDLQTEAAEALKQLMEPKAELLWPHSKESFLACFLEKCSRATDLVSNDDLCHVKFGVLPLILW